MLLATIISKLISDFVPHGHVSQPNVREKIAKLKSVKEETASHNYRCEARPRRSARS